MYPWAVILYLKTNHLKLENENFRLKYSCLVENMKTGKPIYSLIYFPLSMIRKQLFIATQMCLLEVPKVQSYMNAVGTGIVLIYLIISHPFNTKLLNATFIIGELCIFTVFSISIVFSYTDNKELIDLCEKMCKYSIYTCVGIQLMISFITFVIEVKQIIMKFHSKKKEEKTNTNVKVNDLEVKNSIQLR